MTKQREDIDIVLKGRSELSKILKSVNEANRQHIQEILKSMNDTEPIKSVFIEIAIRTAPNVPPLVIDNLSIQEYLKCLDEADKIKRREKYKNIIIGVIGSVVGGLVVILLKYILGI